MPPYLIQQNRSIKQCQKKKETFFLKKLFGKLIHFLLKYRALSLFWTPGINMDMIEATYRTLVFQFFQATSACWKIKVWLFHAGRWTAVHQVNIALIKYWNTRSQIPKCLDTSDTLMCAFLQWQLLFSLQPLLTEPPLLPRALCKGGTTLPAWPLPVALLSLWTFRSRHCPCFWLILRMTQNSCHNAISLCCFFTWNHSRCIPGG